MASQAHCHYCFDVLVSRLNKTKPHPLSEFEGFIACSAVTNGSSSSGAGGINGINGSHGTNGTNGTSAAAIGSNGAMNGNGASNGVNGNGVTGNGVNGVTRNRDGNTETEKKFPLFVTWKKLSGGHYDLRGCIGTFDPKPLNDGLRDYSLTAALHDTRFPPITLKELPSLECSVTLLTNFEPASSPMDWEIGVHGLQIDFVYHNRRMGATYLPDVASEQGWTKEETIVSLMRKAGWTGGKKDWEKVSLKVTRYQGSKESVKWSEYRRVVERMEKEKEMEDQEEEEESDEEEEDEEWGYMPGK
ncbi:AMMECR1 domain-containing protein [Pyronema omphalodes]|nr:AMMECR1 domain-containing protein [Pyronema omphalodes]